MSARNKATIEKANQAFERNDVEALLALCTDDFTWTMIGSDPAVGKAAVREWMAQAPPEPPQFTVETVVADGDYVTCLGDMTMTENGSVVPYAYCDVWRFDGDRIAELRAFVIKTKPIATT
jgi:ketosteroid isomerase-like protein